MAMGSAPVTLEVRSMLPANMALLIVDHAGSVPLVVRTVLADPIARRSFALAPRFSRSPRVVSPIDAADAADAVALFALAVALFPDVVALFALAVALFAAAVAELAAAVADVAADVDPASIAASVSVDTTGSPALSKPSAFVARVALSGSVISMDVGSVTGALIARSASSDVCCANIV